MEEDDTPVVQDGSQRLSAGLIIEAGHPGELESSSQRLDSGSLSDYEDQRSTNSRLNSGSLSDYDDQSSTNSFPPYNFVGPLLQDGSRSLSFLQEDISLPDSQPVEPHQELPQEPTAEPLRSTSQSEQSENEDQEHFEFQYSLIQIVEQAPGAAPTQESDLVFVQPIQPSLSTSAIQDQDSNSNDSSSTKSLEQSVNDENQNEVMDEDGNSNTDGGASSTTSASTPFSSSSKPGSATATTSEGQSEETRKRKSCGVIQNEDPKK